MRSQTGRLRSVVAAAVAFCAVGVHSARAAWEDMNWVGKGSDTKVSTMANWQNRTSVPDKAMRFTKDKYNATPAGKTVTFDGKYALSEYLWIGANAFYDATAGILNPMIWKATDDSFGVTVVGNGTASDVKSGFKGAMSIADGDNQNGALRIASGTYKAKQLRMATKASSTTGAASATTDDKNPSRVLVELVGGTLELTGASDALFMSGMKLGESTLVVGSDSGDASAKFIIDNPTAWANICRNTASTAKGTVTLKKGGEFQCGYICAHKAGSVLTFDGGTLVKSCDASDQKGWLFGREAATHNSSDDSGLYVDVTANGGTIDIGEFDTQLGTTIRLANSKKSGTLTKKGSATLTLQDAACKFKGAYRSEAGNLAFGNLDAAGTVLADGGKVTVTSGSLSALTAGNGGEIVKDSDGVLTVGGLVTIGSSGTAAMTLSGGTVATTASDLQMAGTSGANASLIIGGGEKQATFTVGKTSWAVMCQTNAAESGSITLRRNGELKTVYVCSYKPGAVLKFDGGKLTKSNDDSVGEKGFLYGCEKKVTDEVKHVAADDADRCIEVTANGGTIDIGASPTTIGATIRLAEGADDGVLTKQGSATLTLTDAASGFAGTFCAAEGELALGTVGANTKAILDGGTVTVAGGTLAQLTVKQGRHALNELPAHAGPICVQGGELRYAVNEGDLVSGQPYATGMKVGADGDVLLVGVTSEDVFKDYEIGDFLITQTIDENGFLVLHPQRDAVSIELRAEGQDLVVSDVLDSTVGNVSVYGGDYAVELTAQNSFVGDIYVYSGTLVADRGQGIPQTAKVHLAGGAWATIDQTSLTDGDDLLVVEEGSILMLSATTNALTVNLGGEAAPYAPTLQGTTRTLELNTYADATKPLTFMNPIGGDFSEHVTLKAGDAGVVLAGGVALGDNRTLYVEGGNVKLPENANVTARKIVVNYGSKVTQNGGTVALNCSVDPYNDFNVGHYKDSLGTYDLNAGSVTCQKHAWIGYEGTGTLNVRGSGARFTVQDNLLLASQASSTGTVNVTGGGRLEAGCITCGSGTAALNVDGGTIAASGKYEDFFRAPNVPITIGPNGLTLDTGSMTLKVAEIPVAEGSEGSLTKTGTGRLELGTPQTNVLFNVSAGTLAITGEGAVRLNSVSGEGVEANGPVTISGVLSPGGDGTAGTLTLGADAVVTGEVRLDEGDMIVCTGSLDLSQASFTFASGSFKGVFATAEKAITHPAVEQPMPKGCRVRISPDGKSAYMGKAGLIVILD